MYVYTHTYIHTYICVCLYVYIYIYIHIYIYTTLVEMQIPCEMRKHSQRYTMEEYGALSKEYRALLIECRALLIVEMQIRPGRKTRHLCTGWRRPIWCLELQVIFWKRVTNYRALLRKMTFEDKASYGSSPPCMYMCIYVHMM